MLGLAAYIWALVYGRVAKGFARRQWLILFAVAVATTLISALIMRTAAVGTIIASVVFQFVMLALCFALGVGLGRWLDRNKELD